MMRLVYDLSIFLYGFLVRIAALFDAKARKWVEGRRGLFAVVEKALEGVDRDKNPVVWFHVSSLGEFEQGRSIIEAYRKAWPGHRILLTFFSPSGYEIRKNYDRADWVFFLPLDTPGNARRWVETVRPSMAVFVKYDFWFNLMAELHGHGIPVYFVSVVFRPEQHFFRAYGRWFRRQLDAVTWFFAQNSETESLLNGIGKRNVTVTGDTRFDRVYDIASMKRSFPLVELFAGGNRVVVFGSTWKEDELLLLPFINRDETGLKFIIAPHDTSPERVRFVGERVTRPMVLLSELNEVNAVRAKVLLVDSVGILAHLYRYASLAYIGGAFGAGLHNIQEPVTFGVPVFFGPRYRKFREAVDLVRLGGAFPIRTAEELAGGMNSILADGEACSRIAGICRRYVEENRGATEKVIRHLQEKG